MLYFPIKNYDEFKELFGMQQHDNGNKSRKNKILLKLWTCKDFFKYAIESAHRYNMRTGTPNLMSVTEIYATWLKTMTGMENLFLNILCPNSFRSDDYMINGRWRSAWELAFYRATYIYGKMWLNNRLWLSDKYDADDMCGITADGDTRSIRYINRDSGKVYKMKASKMYKHLIDSSTVGKHLPEQVTNYLVEVLTLEWTSVSNVNDRYELHVDRNFSDIYDSSYCPGDFGSCMVDEERDSYYSNCVPGCRAAYLTDNYNDDVIVARAILFKARDIDTDEVVKLCERQYATDKSEVLKQILVNRLIKGEFIDGYKKVGAGCHDTTAFVGNNGDDWSDRDFAIECNIDPYDDIMSYQDSFIYYNESNGVAYNQCRRHYDYRLDTTDKFLEERKKYWDEYHDRYTYNDVITVYVNGSEMTCDEEYLDDFTEINDVYYHNNDVSCCDNCNEAYVSDDGVYSDLTEEYYCCDACKENGEIAFIRRYISDPDYFSTDELNYILENYPDLGAQVVGNRTPSLFEQQD
jgi:hypothetical protein